MPNFYKAMQCNCGGEMRYNPNEFTVLQRPLKYNICNKCGKVVYYMIIHPAQFATYGILKLKENTNGTEN